MIDVCTIQLRTGEIWANTDNKFDPTSPFGGYKESGFGREGGCRDSPPFWTYLESSLTNR